MKLSAPVCGLCLLIACQKKVPEPEPESESPAAVASASSEPEHTTESEHGVKEHGTEPEHSADADAAASPPSDKKVDTLVKEDVKVGKGTPAKKGDRVSVHYTGRLLDGTKFDSSLDRNQPFEFELGAGRVIKGWDEGVVGMKPGGKRKLTIPSDMAYGKRGSPPKIPPDAPLVFDIELLAIKN